MTDIELNQQITITFKTDEPARDITLVVLDAAETDAATATADYRAGTFDLDDLLGSIWGGAQITYTENGETEQLTGEQFHTTHPLRDLDGVEPVSVTFEDLQVAA